MELSPFERVMKAIKGEKVDRVPLIYSAADWSTVNAGYEIKDYLNSAEIMAEVKIKDLESMGHDALFGCWDSAQLVEAFGCGTKATPVKMDIVKHIDIKSEDDLLRLKKVDVRKDGRMPHFQRAIRILSDYAKGEIPVVGHSRGPFTTTASLLEVQKFLIGLIDQPDLMKKVLERMTDAIIDYTNALIENGADIIFVTEPVCSGNMISPAQFKEFAYPYLKRYIGSISRPAMLHICGRVEDRLEDIADTGTAILSIDQLVDLAVVRKRIGDRVAFGGNIDPVRVLYQGSVEEVKQQTRKCIEAAGTRRYIFMSGCALAVGTPIENLRAAMEVVRNYPVN